MFWLDEFRYYANSIGDVTVKMAKARMNYSYEYLGNEQKLVRTPLTERCFLTLTQVSLLFINYLIKAWELQTFLTYS